VTGPAAADNTELVDLIADHAGAPVLIRNVLEQVAGVWNQTVSLLRWDGTVLSQVGPELSYSLPCVGTPFLPIDATFDANNVPYILYADTVDTASGPGRFHLRRLVGGAWEAVGPDQGVLPKQGTSQRSCYYRPSIRVLGDGTPIVAYLADELLWVQKLQGNAWVGAVSPSGESYPAPVGQYDLQIDPAGRPVLVRTARDAAGTATVTRLSATPSWDPVGPRGGAVTLPASLYSVGLRICDSMPPGIRCWDFPRTSTSATGRAAGESRLAQFDGSSWSITDGHWATPDAYDRRPMGHGVLRCSERTR
jgi:hypothetical protein